MREAHTTEPEKGRGVCSENARTGGYCEAQQNSNSFLCWVREMAAPALVAARDSGRSSPALHHAARAR